MANEYIIIVVEGMLEVGIVFDAFGMEPVFAKEAVDECCI